MRRRPPSTLHQRVARRVRLLNRKLRWAVKISAPPGADGDVWGDVAFAEDLAVALRRLGQHVRVDRLHAEPDSTRYWDDVILTLRGLDTPHIESNAVNILWVISHPDLVSPSEIKAGWHGVYAASRSWAEAQTSETGLEVIPLLQAVSRDRFSPVGPSDTHQILFVGTTRGVGRPVVLDTAAICDDLEIYGHGWEGLVPSHMIRAERLGFDEVPAAYRGARRVLNDHWGDMKREGFISNRLFDAVASGALVISDHVTGISELFGRSVRTYRTRDELTALLSDDSGWPDEAARLASAESVLVHHSFDARARILVRDALAHFKPKSITRR